MDKNIPEEKRRVYGRRLGRPLNASRQEALDTYLQNLSVPEDLLKESKPIDPRTFFPKDIKNIIFEVGFGDGDHLAKMIERHEDTAFIGAEPYINGMSAFLKQVEENNLDQSRIRVWMDDAIRLMSLFLDNSLDAIYVLNPDPWPKVRHHKRRIISQENLDVFARIMKPGAQLIMTTDVDDLAEWMVTEASNHAEFSWTANSKEDWQTAPRNWIETKYEAKGKLASRKQTYLIFKRN